MNEMTHSKYMLGHSCSEIRRLILQATILRPTTERMLRSAGVDRGMRVLDLGCGTGDVTMLAAELVGPSGSVVGIDRSAEVIAVARERARTAKLGQVTFAECVADEFSDTEPFDRAIGRYVLVHQQDPVSFIRTAARLVRPGGVVAFHEVGMGGRLCSFPRVWLWELVGDLCLTAFRSALPHYDASTRMIEHFSGAGLPHPNLFCEIPVGGGVDSPLYAWATETLRSVLPQLVGMGLVTAEGIAIDTLEGRLRTAVVEARSQIECVPQVCAWASVNAPEGF
jgi:ubiquinone/menaquinone biosynthesis C-methylase UbiE